MLCILAYPFAGLVMANAIGKKKMAICQREAPPPPKPPPPYPERLLEDELW